MSALNAIHGKMLGELARKGGQIEGIFFCPHSPLDECGCRKPRPGLLVEIGRRFNIDLVGVPCVGDSLRDLQAALAVGAVPLLVRTGKGRASCSQVHELPGVEIFDDLSAVADRLAAAN